VAYVRLILMPESAGERHGVAFVPGQVAVLAVAGEAPGVFCLCERAQDAEWKCW